MARVDSVILALALALAVGASLAACGKTGHAGGAPEAPSVAFGIQNGVAYLPFHVMREQGLVEKHAKALGITLKADYSNLGQSSVVSDELQAGQIQFGVAGPPTLVTLHEKTAGDIKAVDAVVSAPSWLNTTNPKIRSVCDFAEGDVIALPTLKSSTQAVTLEMATLKYCGDPFRDDIYTVAMPHPEGLSALLSGGVTAHMTTPPYAGDEVAKGKGRVRTVLSSYDVLGAKGSLVFLIASDRFRLANPKVYAAVTAAFEEAQDFVRKHPRQASAIYLKAEPTGQTLEQVVQQVTASGVDYSPSPVALGQYATFMRKVGAVKANYTVSDLAMPNLQGRGGS